MTFIKRKERLAGQHHTTSMILEMRKQKMNKRAMHVPKGKLVIGTVSNKYRLTLVQRTNFRIRLIHGKRNMLRESLPYIILTYSKSGSTHMFSK
jgi:hypothetical protein